MKDKLTHEVEILGRSVSVLLLAGLIMAAGASAALLDSFGTVDGQADVTQSIQVEGQDGEYPVVDDETLDLVAGETLAFGAEVENHQDYYVGVEIDEQDDSQIRGTSGIDVYQYTGEVLGDLEVFQEGVARVSATNNGFEVTGELADDGETYGFGGVGFELQETVAFENEFSLASDFSEGSHDFQAVDWILFEVDASDVEYDSEVEDDGAYFVANPTVDSDEYEAGEDGFLVLEDKDSDLDDRLFDERDSNGDVENPVEDAFGEDATVQVESLAVATGTTQLDNDGSLDLTYEALEVNGDTVFDFGVVGDEISVPPTEGDGDQNFQIGLVVDTAINLDGSENYGFDYWLQLAE